MKKIIILDFSEGETIILDYDHNVYSSLHIQDFLDEVNNNYDYDLKEGNCEWMIVDALSIKIH